jgi:SAM-dependent methyltransferase
MTALVAMDGHRIELDVARWREDLPPEEWSLLRHLPVPILDVGCGPGRVVTALAAAGRPCLGIDPSPFAVDEARARGGSVLQRSIFDPLPGEGRWGGVVLLDGNVGIGGDPRRLLGRVRDLLRADGSAVVELAPPGQSATAMSVRVERPGAAPSDWFRWAQLAADGLPDIARRVGMRASPARCLGSRWFATVARQ